MSEPSQKCLNYAFKLIFTLELFLAFKMAHSCCFCFGQNRDFLDSPPPKKNFYNINYNVVLMFYSFWRAQYFLIMIFHPTMSDRVEVCWPHVFCKPDLQLFSPKVRFVWRPNEITTRSAHMCGPTQAHLERQNCCCTKVKLVYPRTLQTFSQRRPRPRLGSIL